jgi:hypothetical protein
MSHYYQKVRIILTRSPSMSMFFSTHSSSSLGLSSTIFSFLDFLCLRGLSSACLLRFLLFLSASSFRARLCVVLVEGSSISGNCLSCLVDAYSGRRRNKTILRAHRYSSTCSRGNIWIGVKAQQRLPVVLQYARLYNVRGAESNNDLDVRPICNP